MEEYVIASMPNCCTNPFKANEWSQFLCEQHKTCNKSRRNLHILHAYIYYADLGYVYPRLNITAIHSGISGIAETTW